MKCWLPVVALVLSATLGAQRETSAGVSRAERASALFESASRRIASGTHEQRQFALTELQDAARLDPGRADIALRLGTLCLEADLLKVAREVAQRLTARDSGCAGAWLLDGQVWRRYWLATVDENARDRAIVGLGRSARLAPGERTAWALLAPLLTDADELEAAYHVAVFAARAAPTDPEAEVQMAAAAERVGDLETADRLFRSGLPRLPFNLRERYDDIAPLLPSDLAEQFATLEPAARKRFIERFWADNDPDPVSVENEARLEYWARVTQAISLYGTSRADEWDARAQYYVRFGRPGYEELNPIGTPSSFHTADCLAWTYPDLGLRVWMASQSAFHGFPGRLSTGALWARAWPESLTRHGELYAINGGWAVFHRLPPGVTALDARLALARFQSERGISVFAQAEAAGGPDDQLTVEWVVLDSTDTPVTRDRRSMSPSACSADEARAASFTATLPPGHYSIGVRVSDTLGRRGTVRRRIVAPPTSGQLALSDLVVTCSSPAQSVVAGSGVRLEPETGLFPGAGEQLNAYFEIYHLAQSASGDSKFEYDCTVRPAVRDRRGWLSRMLTPREAPQPIEMSRMETTRGSLRRQFLSVPVGSLPTGSYQLAVVVRDIENGAIAQAVTSFERRR
jgi:GWxTD domain-containing protein